MSEIEKVRYEPIRHAFQKWVDSRRAEPAPGGIPGYITEAEQAAKDGISLATLRRRRARKYGPQPVPFGRKFYYREDATERWLEEQEAAAEAATEPRRRGRPRRAG